MQDLSNRELLDELERRLIQNCSKQTNEELLLTLKAELRQLGLRLQESENNKSQFLSNVRNEVNNPLTAIIGLAANIGTSSSDETIRDMSLIIEKEAAGLEFQMRNIIMAAEIEAGELKTIYSRVDVPSLVKEQVKYLRHRIKQHCTSVELRMPDQLEFGTDGQILQSISLNLLANAITYCGGNKNVILNIEHNDRYLELSVIDFGNGIEPSFQSEIFQRFRQGETGFKKRYCGHGLGLCIVKELTAHLNGTIEIHSTPGEGTTVKIIIPECIQSNPTRDSVTFGNELLFNDMEV